MEDPTNPMVVNGLLELATRLETVQVARILEERLVAIPRFRARLVERRLFGWSLPRWEPYPAFRAADHIEHVELKNDDALRLFVGRIASTLLDPSRPPWRVYVIDRPDEGTVILCRIHHALADGFALLRVLRSLSDEEATQTLSPPRGALRNRYALLDHAKALARLLALPRDPPTMLKGPLGVEKRVAWSAPLQLEEIKAVAHATSTTVNDVLVATYAGALRRYFLHHGAAVDGLDLHAFVPVNLRPETLPDLQKLGNDFGLVLLALPVGVPGALDRLTVVKRRMDRIKATPEPIVTRILLDAMGRAPRRVEALAVAFFGKKASLVLTNLAGPREHLHLAGAQIKRLLFWAPQSGRVGMGIAVFSYAGEVTMSILCDGGLIPDPELLARELAPELIAIAAQAGLTLNPDPHIAREIAQSGPPRHVHSVP